MTTPEDRLRNLESTFQQLATKSDTPDLRRAINDPDLSLREEIARAGTTMAQRDPSTTRFFGAMAVVGATSMMTFLVLKLIHCIDQAARPAATHRLTCRIRRSAGSVRVPNPRTNSSKPSRESPSTDVNRCVPLSSFADPWTAQTTDLIRTSQRPQSQSSTLAWSYLADMPTPTDPPAVPLTVHIDPHLMRAAEEVLTRIQMTPDQAIRMFLQALVDFQTMPPQLLVPNEETQRAIEDARAGNVSVYQNVDALHDHLRSDHSSGHQPRWAVDPIKLQLILAYGDSTPC